ncbi:MAG: hypothetical protein JWQ63_1981 [Mucilaginibacter sp.]|nr:hypothetical protein [Mucilaginibacter sp.]
MDQQFNNNQQELWALLANPANDAHLYASNLKLLVNEFPQSGILQALLAHASDEKNLKRASAYFNAKSLFKLINAPSSFIDVADEKIIIQSGISANGIKLLPATETFALLNAENDRSENLIQDDSAIENKQEEWVQADSSPAVELEDHLEIEEDEIYEHDLAETLPAVENENPADHIAIEERNSPESPSAFSNEDTTELINEETIIIDHNSIEEATEDTTYIPVAEEDEKQPEMQIEENTFSEIEQISTENDADADQFDAYQEIGLQDDKPSAANTTTDEAEKLILENIANTDFFMFDRAFGERKKMEQNEDTPSAQSTNNIDTTESVSTEHGDVSNYYDEKMPYSFMWWLDKTRKEHAGLYQPYIKPQPRYSFNKTKKPADELQQQYYENIFHITSLEELDKSTAHQTVEFSMKRKEHQIIERFIQEEPQIKPQSSDKIDNENKAKKSSEDRDELVTETLASIYTEQMLYHKAIASYKKLMLKYPEKSSYFADKIEQIEKKIN